MKALSSSFRSNAVRLAMAVLVVGGFSALLPAEISPREYRRMQREAPEFVRLEVQNVVTQRVEERRREQAIEGRALQVTVKARVMRVFRSHERIHEGEEIRIVYVTHTRERNVPGPGEPPILERGQEYPAFLAKVEGERRIFAPAAGEFSFRPLEEVRR